MEIEILRALLTQGPFAVLFVWLLFRSEKRNEARETEYRAEISNMREEMLAERNEWRKERNVWSDTLRNFSEKYDLVIVELRDIKDRISK